MDKNQNDNRNQPTEGMLKEKTNQDFNKQKPDPKDPLQNKKHQIGEEEENDRREITGNIGDNMDNDRNREEDEDESDDSVDQVTNNNRDQKNRDEESDSFRSENRKENQNTNKGRL
ncbi:MAG: hypothetical protein ACKVQV_03055 [Bacteroidia bacterium]